MQNKNDNNSNNNNNNNNNKIATLRVVIIKKCRQSNMLLFNITFKIFLIYKTLQTGKI